MLKMRILIPETPPAFLTGRAEISRGCCRRKLKEKEAFLSTSLQECLYAEGSDHRGSFTQNVKRDCDSFGIIALSRETAAAILYGMGREEAEKIIMYKRQNIELLMASLEYMENHLSSDIRTEDVAAACFCSKSTLEKLFRCVNGITVHDYVIRRRMMLAARKLCCNQNIPILDIALEYGYSTHESFARAFEQIWNCKPSEFRKTKFTELFPRLMAPLEEGDEYIMQRRHVDISELFDLFQERKDCYFICCDIKHMVPINEISRKAGDLAILEQIRRMTAASGEEDVVFRIGGDEFCILTASGERAYAERIAERITAENGTTFTYEDRQIPLSLYAAVVSVQSGARYEELFTGLHNALKDCKASQCE